MTTKRKQRGAWTPDDEVIDRMERGELRGWDVEAAVGAGEGKGTGWSFTTALERAASVAAFYPKLLTKVVLRWIKPGIESWHRVDECVLLGDVPFKSDVTRLKELGVRAVVTLTNRSYETLESRFRHQDHQIKHLEIPTQDFIFAPSMENIHEAVEFIQKYVVQGSVAYVHCEAGKARDTMIVVCFMVNYRDMTPQSALKHVMYIRPQVNISTTQWQAVIDYCNIVTNRTFDSTHPEFIIVNDEQLDGGHMTYYESEV